MGSGVDAGAVVAEKADELGNGWSAQSTEAHAAARGTDSSVPAGGSDDVLHASDPCCAALRCVVLYLCLVPHPHRCMKSRPMMSIWNSLQCTKREAGKQAGRQL